MSFCRDEDETSRLHTVPSEFTQEIETRYSMNREASFVSSCGWSYELHVHLFSAACQNYIEKYWLIMIDWFCMLIFELVISVHFCLFVFCMIIFSIHSSIHHISPYPIFPSISLSSPGPRFLLFSTGKWEAVRISIVFSTNQNASKMVATRASRFWVLTKRNMGSWDKIESI